MLSRRRLAVFTRQHRRIEHLCQPTWLRIDLTWPMMTSCFIPDGARRSARTIASSFNFPICSVGGNCLNSHRAKRLSRRANLARPDQSSCEWPSGPPISQVLLPEIGICESIKRCKPHDATSVPVGFPLRRWSYTPTSAARSCRDSLPLVTSNICPTMHCWRNHCF